ncbi:hypothetical protein ABZ826_10415 [Streptomyces sp. NPDC047515]|uniref:hypothetical protein n=1 Tax=Streptomyces sp. NPDC047515 TaxID=3155380 RepID=UPI0033E380DC
MFSAEYGRRRRAPLAARALDERRRSALDADEVHRTREETSADPGSYRRPLIDTSRRAPLPPRAHGTAQRNASRRRSEHGGRGPEG